MNRRSPARWLAPLALLAAAFALFVVINGASSDSGSSSSPAPAATSTPTREPEPRERPQPQEPRPEEATYEVQSGDFLSTISEKTGVSVDRIIELNPELDPQALTVGEEIKLRP